MHPECKDHGRVRQGGHVCAECCRLQERDRNRRIRSLILPSHKYITRRHCKACNTTSVRNRRREIMRIVFSPHNFVCVTHCQQCHRVYHRTKDSSYRRTEKRRTWQKAYEAKNLERNRIRAADRREAFREHNIRQKEFWKWFREQSEA